MSPVLKLQNPALQVQISTECSLALLSTMHTLVIIVIISNVIGHFDLIVQQHCELSMHLTELMTLPAHTQCTSCWAPFSEPGTPVHPQRNHPPFFLLPQPGSNWLQSPVHFAISTIGFKSTPFLSFSKTTALAQTLVVHLDTGTSFSLLTGYLPSSPFSTQQPE